MNLFQSQIQQLIESICDDSAQYQSLSTPVKTDDACAVQWRQHLEALVQELKRALDVTHFDVKFSIGASGYPYIKWICILAPGQKVSLGVYVSIRALIKDPDRSWKVYGGICAAVLILCIILSVGFQEHFGQRWTRRLMGMTNAKTTLTH